MPLYEYACRSCDDRFEVLQAMGADARGVSCPCCGGSELSREFSTFAAVGSIAAEPAGCMAMAPGAGCACNPGRGSCP